MFFKLYFSPSCEAKCNSVDVKVSENITSGLTASTHSQLQETGIEQKQSVRVWRKYAESCFMPERRVSRILLKQILLKLPASLWNIISICRFLDQLFLKGTLPLAKERIVKTMKKVKSETRASWCWAPLLTGETREWRDCAWLFNQANQLIQSHQCNSALLC